LIEANRPSIGVTGLGSAVYSNIDFYAEIDFKIKGHIKTHSDTTTLHFVMKTRGASDYEGQRYPFKVTGAYKADVDPKKKALVGSIKATVQIGDEKVTPNETFSEDLPVGTDGSVDLKVVFQEAEKGVVGIRKSLVGFAGLFYRGLFWGSPFSSNAFSPRTNACAPSALARHFFR